MPDRSDPWSLTRRAALGALGVGAAGFALFGPSAPKSAGGAGGGGAGRIVLDYWEKWTRHEGDAMERVVAAFNASQDRIHVRYLVVSDIGQKSMVAIAGGRPPDIIGLYAFNVPPYAEANAVIGLDELAPKFGVRMENYAPGVRQVMRHVGKWWAVVNTAGSVALYYNKVLYREVGLDPERPPRTIEELEEHSRRLVKRTSSGALERVGFVHREPGWWSWLWAYHFGGRIYDETRGLALIDSPENVRAMAWIARSNEELGVKALAKLGDGFGSYFTPENPFLTGKVGMIVQGPWIANLVDAFKPDLDYGVAPFPVASGMERAGGEGGAGPVGLIDTDVLVIPRGARHPEAAMEFIAFTQRQDMTELLARAHCKPSPLMEVSEAFQKTHPNRGIAVHRAILASERAFIAPPTPVWQRLKDEFDGMVLRIASGSVSAAAGCADLQKRAQGMIDDAARTRRARYGTLSQHGGTGVPPVSFTRGASHRRDACATDAENSGGSL
ncbi:MAG: ABC transporter substrate-binding protein [Phycisphaerales bacterium]|nr:ABC transporter substrate-binding protein [Phycisphaerales bacterium]